MTAPIISPGAANLLAEAITCVRLTLDCSKTVVERIRIFWAGVVAARDLGATDVVEEEFLRLAQESGLYADLGPHADADLSHVIRWALLDQNPFQ